MKKIFIILALCFSSLAFATEYSGNYALPYSYDKANSFRTDEPYAKAKSIVGDTNLNSLRQYNAQGYINSVARQINSYSSAPFVRAKMAHDVTALLLSYDAANYWAGTVPQQDIEYVLRTRKAVCEGYANVYKALCDAIGISCQKVHGYARGVGYSNGEYEDLTKSNHAWNIVKLEGAWYLVDCTWDSGHMDGRVSVQDYNTTWLFAKPEYFICTHFPTDDATQQLMARQVSTTAFRSLPNFRPNINDVAALLTFPKKENYINGQCVISYKAKNGGHLFVNLRDSSNTTIFNTFTYKTNDGTTNIFISLPSRGTYKVSIFAYRAGENTGNWCGDFTVTSSFAGSEVSYNMSDEQKATLMANNNTTRFSSIQFSPSDTYIAKSEPSYSYTPSYQKTNKQKKSSSPKYTNSRYRNYDAFGTYALSFSPSATCFKQYYKKYNSADDDNINDIADDANSEPLTQFDLGFGIDAFGNRDCCCIVFDWIFDEEANSDELTDKTNAILFGLCYGLRLTSWFALYGGGGIGWYWNETSQTQFDSKKGMYVTEENKSNGFAYKVNGGIMIPIATEADLKFDVSWNNLCGLTYGIGIGLNLLN